MRVLAALVLGLLGLGPSLAAAQTIKLGAVVPLTGRYGSGRAQVRSGYEIAVEQINAAGGGRAVCKEVPLRLNPLNSSPLPPENAPEPPTLSSPALAAYLAAYVAKPRSTALP